MKYYTFIALTLFFTLGLIGTNAHAKKAETIVTHKNIFYVENSDNKRHRLDIYTPVGDTVNRPVHIFVHGGAWTIGSKSVVKEKDAKAYTDNGVIMVSINYRLSPKYKHPAHVQDVAAAVKWVRDNIGEYGGDANNIVLSGHSAGAHLVALVGTNPKYLAKHGISLNSFQAIVPVDTASFDLSVPSKHSKIEKMRKKAFGTDFETTIEASPISQVHRTRTTSPFHVFVTNEREDAVKASRMFTTKLERYNNPADLYIIEDLSHRQMKLELFKKGSLIHDKVLNAFSNVAIYDLKPNEIITEDLESPNLLPIDIK